MDYIELNTELRNFCKQIINDGYNKSQVCSLLLGQQKLPMFSQFLENESRNFGIGVLAQIFDIFGYKLEVVPVLKTNNGDSLKLVENYNKFIENYRLMISEGLANQEAADVSSGRDNKVATAINVLAMQMFEQITQKGS
jgi:hypothetical protein